MTMGRRSERGRAREISRAIPLVTALLLLAPLVLAPLAAPVGAVLPPDCEIRQNLLAEGCVAWKTPVGDEPARDTVSVLSSDGARVFVGMQWRTAPGATTEEPHIGVAALDAQTGEILWRVGLARGYGTVRTIEVTPDDARVLALAGHQIHFLDAQTGGPVAPFFIEEWQGDFRLSENGTRVYTKIDHPAQERLWTRAYDANTGAQLWEREEWFDSPGIYRTGIPTSAVILHEDTVVVAATDRVFGLDPDTGDRLWLTLLDDLAQIVGLVAAPDGRYALLNHVFEAPPTLHLIDPEEGVVFTHTGPVQDYAEAFAVAASEDTTLAVISTSAGQDRGMYAVDLATGVTRWESGALPGHPISLAPSSDGETLYAGTLLSSAAGSLRQSADVRPGTLSRIDLGTGEETPLTYDIAPPESLLFTPDGTHMLTIGADQMDAPPHYPYLYQSAEVARIDLGGIEGSS